MKKEQYECPGCGKPAPKKTEDYPYWGLPNKFPLPYKGNLEIIRDSGTSLTLWDNESYEHRYEPFCKLRCALNYAQALYKYTGLVTYKQNTAKISPCIDKASLLSAIKKTPLDTV